MYRFLILALRGFKKNKLFTAINVLGLTLGIGCSLCILLFVTDELSYDKHFSNSGLIFRVIQTDNEGGEGSSLPFPTTTTMQHDYPDFIVAQTRLFNFQASTLPITYEDESIRKSFNEPRFFFADSTFFDVFEFPFIHGSSTKALVAPGTVVITRTTAIRYFGESDAVGKVLKFEGKYDLTITGVIEDVPDNTHIKFDFVASFISLNSLFEKGIPENNWYWNPVWAYILLKDTRDRTELEKQMPFFVDKYYHPSLKGKVGLALQPIEDIYLYSKSEYEIGEKSDAKYIYIFSIVGFSILIMAAINFINLTTAQASVRFKEIGVKKILGAQRGNLIVQFLAESFLLILISAFLAIVCSVLALPLLNQLTGKNLTFLALLDSKVLGPYAVLTLGMAIISGCYPAFLLSSRQIITVLKPGTAKSSANAWLRKGLVIFQFVLAIVFISGTLIIYKQIEFMRNKKLGFDSEQILMLPVQRLSIVPKYETFKDKLLTYRNIVSVSSANTIVGKNFQSSNYKKEGESDDALTLRPCLFVRNDFISTMGVKMLAGHDFLQDKTTIESFAIINRSLAAEWGWNNPDDAIGQVLQGTLEGKITIQGVVEDFHFAPLKDAIGPLMIIRADGTKWEDFFTRFIMVRIQGESMVSTLDLLSKEWTSMVVESPFDYFFLNDNLQQSYQAEERFNKIITVFSILAIIISMLGLLGLASFSVHRRTKEVSIRKVLGASIPSLLVMLSRDFMKLIVVASGVAVPLSIYLSNDWLNTFAYRIELNATSFVVSIAVLGLIAFLTIVYVITKAARVNPAETLRNE